MPAWKDALADAARAGDAYYLQCSACETASLPPREVCPACGATDLRIRELSETARVVSYTEIRVSTPAFADATPYTVVLAAFEEGVRLTGQLRGAESVALGETVALGATARADGELILTFTPTAA